MAILEGNRIDRQLFLHKTRTLTISHGVSRKESINFLLLSWGWQYLWRNRAFIQVTMVQNSA
jgi:hypothetical protein